MSDTSLDLSTKSLQKSMRDGASAVDEFMEQLGKLDKFIGSFNKGAYTELEGTLKAVKSMAGGQVKAIKDLQDDALKSIQAGQEGHLNLTKKYQLELQQLYDARLALGGKFNKAELDTWKTLGVSLAGEHRLQLKQLQDFEKNKAKVIKDSVNAATLKPEGLYSVLKTREVYQPNTLSGKGESVEAVRLAEDKKIADQREEVQIARMRSERKMREDNFEAYEKQQKDLNKIFLAEEKKIADQKETMLTQYLERQQKQKSLYDKKAAEGSAKEIAAYEAMLDGQLAKAKQHTNAMQAVVAANQTAATYSKFGGAESGKVVAAKPFYRPEVGGDMLGGQYSKYDAVAYKKAADKEDEDFAKQREKVVTQIVKAAQKERLDNFKAMEDRQNEIKKNSDAVYLKLEKAKLDQEESMWTAHESARTTNEAKRIKGLVNRETNIAKSSGVWYSQFGSKNEGIEVNSPNMLAQAQADQQAVTARAVARREAAEAKKEAATLRKLANAEAAEATRALASVEAELRAKSRELNPELAKTNKAFRDLAFSGNDAHSAARGLASGFGLLWLTWGNMVPLLATAALSNNFREVVQTGKEVEHQLAIIGTLGGATGEQVNKLRDRLGELARSGPFGVTEVAEAMKVLSLAGMQANEILSATQVVLNFSVAGTTDLKTAAETLMSVSTAFNMGSAGFREVADVISKAAAESMTSVENFSSAMKTASVINAQYGVSLKDTATNISALAQLGIQASAAGTAVRNMYADLSGRSVQVAKVLKSQGIELRDKTTGGFRDLVTVVGELNDKFTKLDAIGQKNLMQALLSERGAKGIVEMLRLIQTEATTTGKGFANALEEMRAKLDESAGFSARTAAELAQTVQNQYKSVGAAFSAVLLDSFKAVEPSLIIIADNLKKLFSDETFKSFMVGITNLMATVARVVSDNIGVFTALAGAYAASKVAGWLLAAATDKLGLSKAKLVQVTLENGRAISIESKEENAALITKHAMIAAEKQLAKERANAAKAGTLMPTPGGTAGSTAGLSGAALSAAGMVGGSIVDVAGNVITSQKKAKDAVDATSASIVENTAKTALNGAGMARLATWAGRLVMGMNYVGWAIGIATTAWSLYELWTTKAGEADERAAKIKENNVVDALLKEAKALNAVNAFLEEGLSLKEAQAKADAFEKSKPKREEVARLREQQQRLPQGSNAYNTYEGLIQKKLAEIDTDEKEAKRAVAPFEAAVKQREAALARLDLNKKGPVTGPGTFTLGEGANGGGLRQQGANSFDSLIKSFHEASRSAIAAAKDQQDLMDGYIVMLPHLKEYENDLAKINEQYDLQLKNFKPGAEGYADAVKKLELGRLMARMAAEQKRNDAEYAYGVAQTKKALEEYAAAAAKVVEIKRADARAAWEATRAYEAERAEKERSFKVMEDDAKAKDAQRGMTPADAATYAAQYEIQKKYAGERFKIEQELQKDLEGLVDQDGIEDYQAANRKILQANKKLADLEKDRAKETSIVTAQVQKEEWQKVTDSIATDFTNRMMEGTLDIRDFLKDTFKRLVLQPQMDIIGKEIFGAMGLLGKGKEGAGGIDLFGGIGKIFDDLGGKLKGIFNGGGSSGFLGAGGTDFFPDMGDFLGAGGTDFFPDMGGGGVMDFLGAGTDVGGFDFFDLWSFDGGGSTGSGARAGGLDGKGGFMAMLHPQETVLDHTKGQGVGGGGVNVVINNSVGDIATKQMLDQYQASTIRSVQAGWARSNRYNGAASNA